MSAKTIATCGRCGKSTGPGSAVVLHHGGGGRIHKDCVRPGETVKLANGQTYRNAPQGKSDAAKGTPDAA